MRIAIRLPIRTCLILLTSILANGFAGDTPLTWLTKHQEADGHWDSVKYGATKTTDTATTSLTLLAFLGANNSEKIGEYKTTVFHSVAWLIQHQDATGKITDKTDAVDFPSAENAHLLATLALAEAVAMGNVPATRDAAQKAVDYCVTVYPFRKHVTPENEEVYTIDENVNTPIIGWYVMAIKSALCARLKISTKALDVLIRYLDSVEHNLDKAPGDDVIPVEYWYQQKVRSHSKHPVHRVTAIGCLCRQFLGWKKEQLQSSIDHFVRQGGTPLWDKDAESVDPIYWYFGTLCTFQQGGETWKIWNEALKKALIDRVRKDGDDRGMWDGKCAASDEWGRVGMTALCSLCLETYYAYSLPNSFPNIIPEKLTEDDQ